MKTHAMLSLGLTVKSMYMFHKNTCAVFVFIAVTSGDAYMYMYVLYPVLDELVHDMSMSLL